MVLLYPSTLLALCWAIVLHLPTAHLLCSWDNCPKWSSAEEGNITNVHLICHTHDDMGWIKTADDYYTGAKRYLVPVGVQYILNSVVEQLQRNPRRRFSYAETGFLTRWLEDQPVEQTDKFRQLVMKSGQMEMIGGGWVQPDEAATHYYDLIDQYTLGLRKLNDSYGECGQAKVAWQIDPFGHSIEHANLAVMIGYNALFFGRQHYLESKKRVKERNLEVLWSASEDLKTEMLTGGFYRGTYSPPEGFCFDDLCKDDPVIDNPRFDNYNIEQKVESFVKIIREQTETQRHNHTMMTMGGDFQYSNADMWFSNLDKLIEYINAREDKYRMRLFYSTPSCYVKAVNEVAPHLEQKTDDFFPYASSNHSYWTGYFTSRPTLKGLIRRSSSLLQLARQLSSYTRQPLSVDNQLEVAERAQALAQHHDAVTGTSTRLVAENYVARLMKGWDMAEHVIVAAFNSAIAKGGSGDDGSTTPPPQFFCRRLNESACGIGVLKDGGQFTVTVYNGYGHPVDTMVRIPLYAKSGSSQEGARKVMDSDGRGIKSLVYKSFLPAHHFAANDSAPYQLAFMASEVPALGFKTFFVSNGSSASAKLPGWRRGEGRSQRVRRRSRIISPIMTNSTTTISNELIRLTFNPAGHISSYTDLRHNKTYELKQQFLYYSGAINSTSHGSYTQASGAYIFRPNGTEASQAGAGTLQLDIIKTALFEEARQTVSPWLSQVIRLIANKSYVEFDYIVGPVPVHGINSTEVISRYTMSEIKSNGRFQTDSNGRQTMNRRRNHSDSYEFEWTEPVSANYLPITNRISVGDREKVMSVLTDRAHGASSLRDGEVEIMIHRRCVFDDAWGVDEALNDTLISRGRHWLVVSSPPETAAKLYRTLALELYHQPLYSFSPLNGTVDAYLKNFNTTFAPIRTSLPEGINLLTAKQLTKDTLLVRLEHIYQGAEDEKLSQPITVNLTKLFNTLTVVAVKELKLAANVVADTSPSGRAKLQSSSKAAKGVLTDFNVVLKPMEIRTFEVVVN